jgi:hypothetical protein
VQPATKMLIAAKMMTKESKSLCFCITVNLFD